MRLLRSSLAQSKRDRYRADKEERGNTSTRRDIGWLIVQAHFSTEASGSIGTHQITGRVMGPFGKGAFLSHFEGETADDL